MCFTDDASNNFNMINFFRWSSTPGTYTTAETTYSGVDYAIVGKFNDICKPI